MAGIDAPYGRPELRPTTAGDGKTFAARFEGWLHDPWARFSPGASVLGMFGYFLLLGSAAVVVVTEQFPWFTVAPATILLSIAYFRHVDEKDARRASREGPHR